MKKHATPLASSVPPWTNVSDALALFGKPRTTTQHRTKVTNRSERLPPSWFLPASDSYGDYGDDKAAFDT